MVSSNVFFIFAKKNMPGSILNKKIISLALPFLAANISIPLLGLVDTAVLGHLESEKYLGAIALGSMVFNFLFWGFGFLKMGTTGFTSQAKGKKDVSAVSLVLQRGVIISIALGVLLILLKQPLWNLAALLLEGSDEVKQYALEYYSIRIFAAPAVFLLYVLAGWFLGMQNAVYVLYITITENLLNIIFNLVFIYGFHMRADGVALGTVCAQYTVLCLGTVLLIYKYRQSLKSHSIKIILKAKEMTEYFKVNTNIMIRTVALMFAFAFFTVQSSSVNDVLLASNMILMQFMLFFAYFIDGLAHAGESLSGFFFGASKRKALKILLRKLFLWSLCLALLFSLVYLLMFRNIIMILTNQEIVISTATDYKWWLVAIPILSFAAFVWDGIYIGLTASAYLRNAMLMALFLVYLPMYYIFSQYMGNHALWLAMSAFMLSRGLFLWAFSKHMFSKKIILQN